MFLPEPPMHGAPVDAQVLGHAFDRAQSGGQQRIDQLAHHVRHGRRGRLRQQRAEIVLHLLRHHRVIRRQRRLQVRGQADDAVEILVEGAGHAEHA
ncbi:hypothetical protein D3C72_2074120 [compost metagenome]